MRRALFVFAEAVGDEFVERGDAFFRLFAARGDGDLRADAGAER